MASRQLSKTLTALAGEFLVAGRICMLGYVASLTLKNYPGVDIFALNPRTNRQVAVQVKTAKITTPRSAARPTQYPYGVFFIPESVDDGPDQPFVFVTISSDSEVEYFVVPATQVAEISENERREYLEYARSKGRVVRDDQPRMVSLGALERFKDRWENLGLGD